MSELATIERQLKWQVAAYHAARDRVEVEQQALVKAKAELESAKQAQEILQHLAQQTQLLAHQQVAKIVSRCLSAVFQRPYELRIEFDRKRGKTEAKFVYLRDGHEVQPYLTSGGVRQVTAMALRLTNLILTQPPARRFLALDEPFQGLSAVNLRKMAKLVEVLAAELDVQFLIVTHCTDLQVGKVIHLSGEDQG